MYLNLWRFSENTSFLELLGLRLDTLVQSMAITSVLMAIFYAGDLPIVFLFITKCLVTSTCTIGPLLTWLSHMRLALNYDMSDEDKLVKLHKPKRLLALINAEIRWYVILG